MNKTAIKNYAIRARVQLIESAKQRAYEYEIIEDGENNSNLDSVGGRLLSSVEKEQRKELISQINAKGYAQVMEEAAYTWFNRFIALRFMEVNGYLPSKVRVFTDENNAFKPEILREAMNVELDGIDKAKVLDLLDKQNNEELYKYLLITQCNALNAGLPYMFEKIANWTELLFPSNLLRPDSVLAQMIAEIPEEDWTDAVQIIGWLYQYYNAEVKDEVFANLKKNIKISKEKIPAATQLFTPDWIVRYMVENSLGRLWYEGHKEFDKSGWKYYLDEAEQEPEVESQLVKIREEYSRLKPEDIKVIDPCMGSGHILVYAFDVLMQIYASAGWGERDAAKSILENNLFGLDIDDRAGQLAYFAVMMKARKYNRRILNGEVKPNVMSIQESNWMTDEFIEYVAGKDSGMKADLVILRKTFTDAKEYGSILNVPAINYDALYERIDIIIRSYDENLFVAQYRKHATNLLLPLVKQAQIISRKYDVVVTNPPYMGGSGMSAKLGDFVKNYYPDSKSDIFAVFIECGNEMTKKNGMNCMVTMQSWMFLSSFEKMRAKILASRSITNLMHMDNMVMHIAFGTAVTVFRNDSVKNYKGTYNQVTLKDIIDDGMERPKEFPISGNRFAQTYSANFSKIPGSPVAYWVGEKFADKFVENEALKKHIDARIGMVSGDNNRFLRFWNEVDFSKIEFNAKPYNDPKQLKWYPLQKGGEYRLWYGNLAYVINWENDGFELKNDNYEGSRVRSHNYNGTQQFKEGITWNSITSGRFSCRYSPVGFSHDAAGPLCEVKNSDELYYILAYMSSKVTNYIFTLINPTINFPSGYLEVLPFECHKKDRVDNCAKQNISLSKTDWDSYETSWDFGKHPLV